MTASGNAAVRRMFRPMTASASVGTNLSRWVDSQISGDNRALSC